MNYKQPFFSLIMPVYNAEKFLEKSLESILNQTFLDFELILVDDCSKDASYEICSQFVVKDDRIKLFKNNINSGVSRTRNAGIKKAKGLYIGFVDADDWIELDILENVYNELIRTNCDCLKYGVIEEYFDNRNNITFSKACKPEHLFGDTSDSIIHQMIVLEQYPLFGYCHNTFYRNAIIADNNIYFDESLKVNEDFDFNIRYFKHIQSLSVLDYCGYHYAKREGNSLSSQKRNYSYDVHIKKVTDFLNLIESNNLAQDDLEKIFWMYVRFVYASLENGESFDYIKKQVLFQKFLKIDFRNVSNKQRIMITVLKTKNKVLIMLFLRVISLVKSATPNLFARIKR